MNHIIVYIDDADYAGQVLSGTLGAPAEDMHWTLVACAPRMTQRVSKWASHGSREKWRAKWASRLFADMSPLLGRGTGEVRQVVAREPLPELTTQLQEQHGAARIIDARKPKAPEQSRGVAGNWRVPGLLSALLAFSFVVFE
ncbi:hypothetical protein EC845_4262 [Comamonas sp. BIGb0124]|uniref:hypothetical protein n=1 Tax=Comamonas sp. BIGb0124 TaxID=2485130 RepID=UPI000F46C0F9|nr:hypothetical protein [Comamonas sp. BIGb0124]ROR16290.1 hypothetical protein EC845_4262 [Comamonas sp. BIGb0124]